MKTIDISTPELKNEILILFQSLTSISEACKYFNMSDIPCNRKYIKLIAKEIGFDIDIFNKNRTNRRGEPKKCLCCGKLLKYGQKKFCSNSCSATYNNKLRIVSEDTKKKISESLKRNNQNKRIKNSQNKYLQYSEYITKACKICGCLFKVYRNKFGNFSKKSVCSDECRHQLMILAGKTAYKKSKENGTHKPWMTRNISSYAEKFFENVLDNNNISYIREFYVKDLKYFLDFKINMNGINIDLEIDGKQHERTTDHDKKRDVQLKKLGYIVYRIPWNNINNESGKDEMKSKIDEFLSFISKIKNRVVE